MPSPEVRPKRESSNDNLSHRHGGFDTASGRISYFPLVTLPLLVVWLLLTLASLPL